MLIKTIELETNDDELFSKSAPLLTAASELAFHTINTSILNAEELRREGGIAVSHVNYCPKANKYPVAIFIISNFVHPLPYTGVLLVYFIEGSLKGSCGLSFAGHQVKYIIYKPLFLVED